MIKLKNITKIYGKNEENETIALKNINLEIKKGEYLGILGPSGSGKSTLLHILGLLDKPTKGEIIFENKKIESFKDEEIAKIRRKKIGFVFQNFNLIRSLTVFENVSIPMILDEKKVDEKRVNDLLKHFGIYERRNHYPNQISGGQMQRTAIARALILNPDIILADEPTGNLDTKSGEKVLEIFNKLHKEGRTLIIITHNEEVVKDCNRIIRIKDGIIVDEVKK